MMTRDEAARIQPPHVPRFAKERNPNTCCASISSSGTFFFHQCSRAIKVRYDDLGYCGMHDPAKVKARRDERNAKWQRDWQEMKSAQKAAEKRRAFLDACEKAVRSIADGHNDPMTLCKEILQDEN